jgi:outer membrane protein TolC
MSSETIAIALSLCILAASFPVQAAEPEPVTWKECLQEATANHPDLAAAREQAEQARASRNILRGALFPHLSAFADQSRFGSSLSPTAETYSYGVTASQLLFDGFKTPYDVSAATRSIQAAEFRYIVTSADVRFRLRSAFVDLLRSQELLAITGGIADRRRKNRELVGLRYNAGREHKGSLLTADASLAQADFEVSQARRGIDLSRQKLSREMGRIGLAPLAAQGSLDMALKTEKLVDLESIVQRNPVVLQQAALKEEARYGLKAARADRAPKFYANATAARSSSDWPPREEEWTVGLNVTLPLFEGGIRQAGIARARAGLRQAEAEERSIRDEALVALREARTRFENAAEQAQVQQKFLAAAEARATISRAQYSTGLISFDNWTIIEDDLVRVEKAMLDARANALTTEAAWIQAQGGALEDVE